MSTLIPNERETPATKLAIDPSCASIQDVPLVSATGTLGAIVIGGDFQTLGVIRALHAEKIPVFLIESEAGIAKYSRFAVRRAVKHDLLNADDAVDYLLKLANSEQLQGWTIFCVNDDTVEFLAKNHATLSEKFVSAVPPWEITHNFFDKDRAYRLAESVGLAIPAMYSSESLEAMLATEIRYPIVLKPTFKKNYYEKTNAKAILITDRESLVREFTAMNAIIPASQIVVQEFIPGGTRNLYSFAALFDGDRVISGLAAHRLRQHPMDFGHATTYAEARDMPELEALATRFLSALKYRGVAEVEFMFDERTGEYKFIEMNGRFWGWHVLTHAAGLNFPADLYRMLLGNGVERKMPRTDVAWLRLITDMPTVLQELFRGRLSLRKYLLGMTRSKGYAVWSWSDPLPAIAELMMAPYLFWKKGF